MNTSSPNLGLNLDICDLINKNLKTYPRDAAFAIVGYVNQSSSSAFLALTLLDNCVKNCGYPFHLVISSKEFLNELVRQFPEYSEKHVSSTQRRILEFIGDWNYLYAIKSRYKDDYKHINDMYRLLEFKGYRFPKVQENVLNSSEPVADLKTEEQLEYEDNINNGVKLEELIRKGTPAALAEANDMMNKDTSKKPDYKKEVTKELDRMESKLILLNDMLNQKSAQDFKTTDLTIEDLYTSAKVGQNRLTTFIKNNDDESRMGRLLAMNDMISTVIQKYSDLKSGKEAQKNIFDRRVSNAAVDMVATGMINLIDFDDFTVPQTSNVASTSGSKIMANELLDMDFLDTQPSSNVQQSSPMNFNQAPFQQPMYNQIQFSPSDPFKLPSISKEYPIYTKNGLSIKLNIPSTANMDSIQGRAIFQNSSTNQIANLHFEMSLPISMNLKIDSASATSLQAFNQDTVYQQFYIQNPNREALRIRFRINYSMNGIVSSDIGECNI